MERYPTITGSIIIVIGLLGLIGEAENHRASDNLFKDIKDRPTTESVAKSFTESEKRLENNFNAALDKKMDKAPEQIARSLGIEKPHKFKKDEFAFFINNQNINDLNGKTSPISLDISDSTEVVVNIHNGSGQQLHNVKILFESNWCDVSGSQWEAVKEPPGDINGVVFTLPNSNWISDHPADLPLILMKCKNGHSGDYFGRISMSAENILESNFRYDFEINPIK